MKLTGKCKEAFKNQLKYIESIFNELPNLYKQALIIEFFDSVGVYISVVREFESFEVFVNNNPVAIRITTREEAINVAIEKANDLFNSK